MRVEGEEKYFTAEDAKQVSEEIKQQKTCAELDEVYKLINDYRFKGERSFTIHKFLSKSTESFLRDKGFAVIRFSGCQWDPATDTTISW